MSDPYHHDHDEVVVERDGSAMGVILGIIILLVIVALIWWFSIGPGTSPNQTAPAASQPAVTQPSVAPSQEGVDVGFHHTR